MPKIHLGQLLPGQTATILELQAENKLQHRLRALGFHKNRQIEMIRRGWFSGPLHVRIGTTEVMLRRREASEVYLIDVTTRN